MQLNNETQFHIQEAMKHLRKAGTVIVQQAAEVPESEFKSHWDSGNELHVISNHLEDMLLCNKVSQLQGTEG